MPSDVRLILKDNNFFVGDCPAGRDEREGVRNDNAQGSWTDFVHLKSMHVILSTPLVPIITRMMERQTPAGYQRTRRLMLQNCLGCNEQSWDITLENKPGEACIELSWKQTEIQNVNIPMVQRWNDTQPAERRIQSGDIVIAVQGHSVVANVNHELQRFKDTPESSLTLKLVRSAPKSLEPTAFSQRHVVVPIDTASDPSGSVKSDLTIATRSSGAKPFVPRPGFNLWHEPAGVHFESPLARDRDYGRVNSYSQRLPRYPQHHHHPPSCNTDGDQDDIALDAKDFGEMEGDAIEPGGLQNQHVSLFPSNESNEHQPTSQLQDHKMQTNGFQAEQTELFDDGVAPTAPSIISSMPSLDTQIFTTAYDQKPFDLINLASKVFGAFSGDAQERWDTFVSSVVEPWIDSLIKVESLTMNERSWTQPSFKLNLSKDIRSHCFHSEVLNKVFIGDEINLPFASTFKTLFNEDTEKWSEEIDASKCVQSVKQAIIERLQSILRKVLSNAIASHSSSTGSKEVKQFKLKAPSPGSKKSVGTRLPKDLGTITENPDPSTLGFLFSEIGRFRDHTATTFHRG